MLPSMMRVILFNLWTADEATNQTLLISTKYAKTNKTDYLCFFLSFPCCADTRVN